MALTIETGAIVPNANSYATVEELRAYAALRGVSVPESILECEQLLVRAMDYITERYGERFVGEKVSASQPLHWPRYNAEVEGYFIPPNEIPRQLVQGQCAVAIEAQGRDLLPTTDAAAPGPIVSESVGPITTVYANTGNVSRVAAVAKADALLRTLIHRGGLFAIRA